jgi:hypothetical protein
VQSVAILVLATGCAVYSEPRQCAPTADQQKSCGPQWERDDGSTVVYCPQPDGSVWTFVNGKDWEFNGKVVCK